MEICLNSVWGIVCDDNWGIAGAQVVYRQLGYPTLGDCMNYSYTTENKPTYKSSQSLNIILLDLAGARPFKNAHFGQGAGPIHLNFVQCIGNELNLLDCPQLIPSVHTVKMLVLHVMVSPC